MKHMDKIAARIAVVRMPGESDYELLSRCKAYYATKDYEGYLPLLRLLDKFKMKSTRWLLNRTFSI